jgi:hypothetical protein
MKYNRLAVVMRGRDFLRGSKTAILREWEEENAASKQTFLMSQAAWRKSVSGMT